MAAQTIEQAFAEAMGAAAAARKNATEGRTYYTSPDMAVIDAAHITATATIFAALVQNNLVSQLGELQLALRADKEETNAG